MIYTRQNYYVEQEVQRLQKVLAKEISDFDELFIVNSDQEEASVLLEHLSTNELPQPPVNLFRYKNSGKLLPREKTVAVTEKNWRALSDSDFLSTTRKLILLFNNRTLDQKDVKAQLHLVESLLRGNANNQFIMVSESYVNSIPCSHYLQYSEHEYSLSIEKFADDSLEKMALQNDKLCEALSGEGINACVLNYANLFGPSIGKTHNNTITQICHAVAKNRAITFGEADKTQVFSYTYISDIYNAIARLIDIEETEYSTLNVSSYISDAYSIKLQLSTVFSDYPVQPFAGTRDTEHIHYAMLQAMKVRRISKRTAVPTLRVALEHTVLSEYENTEIDEIVEKTYNEKFRGKIDRIRGLELDILRDIHRICEKYGLHYVLTAGTMLGAVRHQGFIPWDDDADIGMSREDFEVFRKVAPKELQDRFYYQNSLNSDESHYVLDKIRLKNTSLSTRWTSMFNYPDGVYVDIYVYDKTSNNAFMQKLHVKALKLIYQAITLRWVNKARRHKKYVASKVVLPVLRLFSNEFLYKTYERTLMHYSKSSNSQFVLDGVGGNLKKGGIPAEWLFSGRKLMRFENEEFYVPEQYEQFLSCWYGEDFMDLLPVAKRNTHNYIDIDLGPYLETEKH